MSRETEATNEVDLDLSPETLKQWESELEQFVTGTMQRLSKLSHESLSESGNLPQNPHVEADKQEKNDVDEIPEALQLLQSIRELTQSSPDNIRGESL